MATKYSSHLHWEYLKQLLKAAGKPGIGQQPLSAGFEAALDKLGSRERACLFLREGYGLPVAEIAQITAIEREEVCQILFSAREGLRTLLWAEG